MQSLGNDLQRRYTEYASIFELNNVAPWTSVALYNDAPVDRIAQNAPSLPAFRWEMQWTSGNPPTVPSGPVFTAFNFTIYNADYSQLLVKVRLTEVGFTAASAVFNRVSMGDPHFRDVYTWQLVAATNVYSSIGNGPWAMQSCADIWDAIKANAGMKHWAIDGITTAAGGYETLYSSSTIDLEIFEQEP